MIDQRELAPEFIVAAGAEVDVQLQQALPLVGGEDAAALLGARQAFVRGAEDDQVLHVPAAVAVKVARADAVEGDGDGADVVAGEHQREEAGEALTVHRGVAEDGGALLERPDAQLPELSGLGGAAVPADALQLLRALSERLRQAQRGKEAGQGPRLFARGPGLLHRAGKGCERP